jgi:hypothetical protein
MNITQYDINSISLPDDEFNTIHLGSLEDVTTGIGSEIKFIVTHERNGVYSVFAASVDRMKYHEVILKNANKAPTELVGGGRIVTSTIGDTATVFFGNFSEAFGSVPPVLNRRIEEIMINTLRNHFHVETLRITDPTFRKNEVHTEPNSIFSPIMHLSWLRFRQIFEAANIFFDKNSKDGTTNHGKPFPKHMMDSMQFYYDQWRQQMESDNYDKAKETYIEWRYLVELWNDNWRIQPVDTGPKVEPTKSSSSTHRKIDGGSSNDDEDVPF